MASKHWKKQQPRSLRHGMELCLEHARVKKNYSVDRVADEMGLSSKWQLYKWMENSRMPIVLVRPFERACGADYVTRYIGHSAFKLLIDIPVGKRVSDTDINTLQGSFSEAIGLLLKFYDGKAEVHDTLAALSEVMEKLAWHQGNVERYFQPELEFEVNEL
ncbi:MAG: hypothetical protein BVN35_20330 [Proteobacteria bacterium ST_bin11]|nr:MAG: hypothetical protein BVN35_20330 [Proteobacteria bacterium ST_bin11]